MQTLAFLNPFPPRNVKHWQWRPLKMLKSMVPYRERAKDFFMKEWSRGKMISFDCPSFKGWMSSVYTVHSTFIAAACSNRNAKKKSFHIQSLAFSISNERMLLCEIQEVTISQQKSQTFMKHRRLYVHLKYFKHWPYFLAGTLGCGCHKILNHDFFHFPVFCKSTFKIELKIHE